jgi:hypothetical protein
MMLEGLSKMMNLVGGVLGFDLHPIAVCKETLGFAYSLVYVQKDAQDHAPRHAYSNRGTGII